MTLYLNHSGARRRFKDLLGNANHLLITILVGLDAVDRELVKEVPPYLHAAWNPKDVHASAARARVMVLEATLVRATDALDAYLTWSRREPSLVQADSLRSAIDNARHSIFEKLSVFHAHYSALDPALCALLRVMITWRNKTVHSTAEVELPEETWSILTARRDWLEKEFGGMEIDRLFVDFEKDGPPTFKETASFIRAAQKFVEHADAEQLRSLDTKRHLRDLIWSALGVSNGKRCTEDIRRRRAQSIWNRELPDRVWKVRNFLKNCGLSEKRASASSAEFSAQEIDELCDLASNELLRHLRAS